MIRSLLLAACVCASVVLPATSRAQENQPFYLLAMLDVPDLAVYMAEYGAPVMPMLMAAGGEVLVGTPQVEVLEGDFASTWTVVVRFPSAEAAKGWYLSPKYHAMIPVRHGLTDTERSVMLIAPAFMMPEQ